MKLLKLKSLIKEEIVSQLKDEYSMTHDYHGDDDVYSERGGHHITISDADDTHFTGYIELGNDDNIRFEAEYKLYSERNELDPGGYRGSQFYKPSYSGYTFEFNNLKLNFYEPGSDDVRVDNNKLIGLYEEDILKAADEFLNKKANTHEYPH